MNIISALALATTLFLGSSMALACDYPDRPLMPDGKTASKDDLLAAKDDVQSFVAGVDEYLNCIETEEKEAVKELRNPSSKVLDERDDLLSSRFDAANEEKALVGEQFNLQIRAYNKKVQDSKD
jgi:hypothetical protein